MEEKIHTTNRYQTITLFFVIIVLLGGFVLLQGKDSFFNLSKQVRLKPGMSAPNFNLPDLDGKMVDLTDYKGNVVFLNIWATWCGPCREEMPSMERLYQKLKAEDFIILAVSIDASAAKAVAPFVNDFKLNFPILLDPKGSIQILYGTTGIPESFIIDKKGVLAQITLGPRDWDSPDAIHFFRNLIQKP